MLTSGSRIKSFRNSPAIFTILLVANPSSEIDREHFMMACAPRKLVTFSRLYASAMRRNKNEQVNMTKKNLRMLKNLFEFFERSGKFQHRKCVQTSQAMKHKLVWNDWSRACSHSLILCSDVDPKSFRVTDRQITQHSFVLFYTCHFFRKRRTSVGCLKRNVQRNISCIQHCTKTFSSSNVAL
jgi:hypothetical protein